MIQTFLFGKAQSRWLILLIDLIVAIWAFSISFLISTKFWYLDMFTLEYLLSLCLYSFITTLVFIGMKIHTGLIRYSNTTDIFSIFSATLICNVIYWVAIQGALQQSDRFAHIQFKQIIIFNFFISSTMLILFRLLVKSMYHFYTDLHRAQIKPIIIFGSDRSSVLIKQAFEDDPEIKYEVLGFIDDDVDKVGKYIEQKKVFKSSSIKSLKDRYSSAELIVNSNCLNRNGKKQAIEKCIEVGIKVLTVPPADQWLNGRLSLNQVADLKIEDLLQRRPIVLNKTNILNELSGKRILITGAAGSIGSEIVRQVTTYNPELVVLCDQAESPLHELQLELEDKLTASRVQICIANIQNVKTMKGIFNAYKPQVVFHAAAYKHVPMMENNPCEAILDNVVGTKNIADISVLFGVEKFVMISTDKAVNPTNVMGASKRLAEMYIQSLNNLENAELDESGFLQMALLNNSQAIATPTKFITTRFGNVLGSNGSVIPRFKAQIERGGPVTVTHPEITRYFMTITESVQLVLEAAAMGNGGEIFIFDMGEPVKIVDLASNMIKLTGLVPGKDIKIEFTGLRPGEKLYEELLNKEELTIPTHHEKIKISRVILYPYQYIQQKINELINLNNCADEIEVVSKMKEIIPEFKSNNSRFSELDLILQNL
ncbi:nucleoside-diphosphate sugar epimerase/dehydratase [Pedobacter sp. P351]|uniref:nucleoside-diphosphate sugar epimerase/dehydratase n=1 Tax=Pedobacter superstes TaxID=3133441 RepID=UPI00309F02B9